MYQQLICFLAQGNAGPTRPEPPPPSSFQQVLTSPELKLVLGLVAVLTAALVVWALVIRRRRPTDPHLRVIEAGRVSNSGAAERHGRRRRHRRRRDGGRDRRNHTLQETGGLPPLRPEDDLPKG
jgi:hypothetical protein